MYVKQPKRLLVMNILDILNRYTDENHRLSQKEISDILKREYSMHADRKAIRRNLLNLIDCGYPIEYSETVRMIPNSKTGEPEKSYIWSDFYLERDFSDAELRLLIDSLLFSKHIPYNQCRDLIEKLEGLSSKYFEAKVKHIRTLDGNQPANKQLFYTIDILDEAISKGRQVKFHYAEYGTDKKLHNRKNREGTTREYIINPYQIVVTNGRYYLICNYDKYNDLSNYRVDRITDIELLNTSAKPKRKVKGAENGFDLSKHMAEHIYMFSDESDIVTFRVKKYILDDVMDWFGKDLTFFDEAEDEVSVRVQVNLAAMRCWAMQYALHARVLSPESLVEQVKEDIKEAMENYNK